MDLKNNIYVVSLTHWDREWRFPFEKTRVLLMEMMDNVLVTLDSDPDYKCFHLDGQTILLDDYVEARPENKDKIIDYVKQGRIIIGPWYVLPDENQLSGESLVRNFLWGEKVGRKYGGNMKVGYTPTSWGQVSQMPQVMKGFDLNSIIFYRGITPDQSLDNFYIWQGSDGTQILGVKLGNFTRVCFFQLVDRPIAYKRRWHQGSYDWRQGGKPFRICGSGSANPYEFYQPPMGWHPEEIESAVKDLEEKDLGQWMTSWALAMECDDCTGPFALTTKIIKEINKKVTNGKKVVQGSLPEFIEMASKELDMDKLKVLTGEMRHNTRVVPELIEIYADIQSCRIPTKYMNRGVEFALQRVAEPLATIALTIGYKYPEFILDKAWHLLLQNHAHDSLGGCGRDSVDIDVRYRFHTANLLASGLINDMARNIAGKIDTSNINIDEILLVVFNPLPRKISKVVNAEVDITKEDSRAFKLCRMDGGKIAYQVNDKFDHYAVFNHPNEQPHSIFCNRFVISFEAENVPSLGYKIYRVVPGNDDCQIPDSMLVGDSSMKNEYLDVIVNQNGTVNITSLDTGRTFANQNVFEDSGDVGDYLYKKKPKKNKTITSLDGKADLKIIEDGEISVAIEANIILTLPAKATEDAAARADETKPFHIKTVYRLNKGEKFLRIKTTIENDVEDHVLRALFATGVRTDVAFAEVPFDVLARRIPLSDTEDWCEPYNPCQPHQNFVDLSDGDQGVAIMNKGLPQYEAVDNADRTIALTLLRSHRAWNSVRMAKFYDEQGPQIQGTHTFEYAIFPHKGNWEKAEILYESEKFNIDFVVGAAGAGKGKLPTEYSFVEIQGSGLVLNALKKCQWDDSLIIRLSNPTTKQISGTIKLHMPISKAESVNMMETQVQQKLAYKNNSISVEVPPKKIMTIRIEFTKGF